MYTEVPCERGKINFRKGDYFNLSSIKAYKFRMYFETFDVVVRKLSSSWDFRVEIKLWSHDFMPWTQLSGDEKPIWAILRSLILICEIFSSNWNTFSITAPAVIVNAVGSNKAGGDWTRRNKAVNWRLAIAAFACFPTTNISIVKEFALVGCQIARFADKLRNSKLDIVNVEC